MQLAIELPEEIGEELPAKWKDLPAAVLEALALEGYRCGALTESQVGRMLGLQGRMQVNQFLADHGIYYEYSPAEIEDEIERNERLIESTGTGTRSR